MKLKHDVFQAYVKDIDGWKAENPATNTYDALAKAIGVKPTVMYNYMEWNDNGDGPKTFPPIENLVAICNRINRYSAIQVICGGAGGFFTQKPDVDPQDELGAFGQLDNLHSKTVDVSQTLRNAWADGQITTEELNAIIRVATDSQAANQQIIEWAQDMAKKRR